MKKFISNILISTRKIWEIILFPQILFSSYLLLAIRKIGVYRMPLSKKIFFRIGVFPIREHYYEPSFNPKNLKYSLDEDRKLTGIDMNHDEQKNILKSFNYQDELKTIPFQKSEDLDYYYNNGSFESPDSEYLYSLIRKIKPSRVIEIGSGHSTLMMLNAIKKNKEEDQSYQCEVICIEPYEMPWLEKTGVTVIRKLVENVELDFFKKLQENDILFIDSSHVIRPQGDVLFEYLEILPVLNKGVYIHVHDIFTPKDYLHRWVVDQVRLWNEQYLLEAFLSFNNSFKITGALNYLYHHEKEMFMEKFPMAQTLKTPEPKSFYFKKII